MTQILLLIILLLGAFFTTQMICFLARKKSWYDIPNSRSSHSIPTPKGGGVAFVLMFFCAVVYVFAQGLLLVNELLAFVVCLLIAVLGFMDDLWELSAKVRVVIHLAAVLLVLLLLGGQPEISVFSVSLNFGVISYCCVVVAFIWLINLYNFMDGIDGLAALEAVFVSLAASCLVWQQDAYTEMFLLQSLAVSVLGFSFFNLPPAKIFMGDVGSKFLGFVFGVFGLITIDHGLMSVWTWSVLLGIFVVDATTTLVRRFFSNEVWYQAHRSHAYQQAATLYGGHAKVDWFVCLLNCFWLFPIAWATVIFEDWGVVLVLLAYVPLVFLGEYVKSRNKLEVS